MKIAFVHCWVFPGGALEVCKDLIDEQDFHHGTLFTLISDRQTLITKQGKEIHIITALPTRVNSFFLFFSRKNIFILSTLFDYRNLIFFYPVLIRFLSRKIKKYQAQKIIISSFAIAKNIHVHGTETTLYLHSPMQYIRDHYDEYVNKLPKWKLFLFRIITPYLRKRDKKQRQYDHIFANSHYTASLAKKIYGMKNITVQYPHIPDDFFHITPTDKPHDYYIYVGRLVRFVKEVDVIIKLCNEMKVNLLIIGAGPDKAYLQSIAKENITFIDRINDTQERINIMKHAKGLINLTKESFGITTAESLLCGVPVFGYDAGATPELVDKESGMLVSDKNIRTLKQSFEQFMHTDFDRNHINKRIKKLRKK